MYILEYFTSKWPDGAHAEKYRQGTLDKKEETGTALLYIFIAPNQSKYRVNQGGGGVSFGGDAQSR